MSTPSALQRRDTILGRIQDKGHVAVRELAELIGVSEATVRRDLRQLADERSLELVYGGATTRRQTEHSLQARAARNRRAKQIVGRLAAELVQDGDTLFVDPGTTCYEMLEGLMKRRPLTVIANSTRLSQDLAAHPECEVVLIGGHYRPDRMDTCGPLAANSIDQMRGYRAFIGTDGLSVEFGVSANDIQTAYLFQHVIRNARETILLVDHTKLAAPSLFRICGIEDVSRVVIDRDPGPEWREALTALGIDLICETP